MLYPITILWNTPFLDFCNSILNVLSWVSCNSVTRLIDEPVIELMGTCYIFQKLLVQPWHVFFSKISPKQIIWKYTVNVSYLSLKILFCKTNNTQKLWEEEIILDPDSKIIRIKKHHKTSREKHQDMKTFKLVKNIKVQVQLRYNYNTKAIKIQR